MYRNREMESKANYPVTFADINGLNLQRSQIFKAFKGMNDTGYQV